MNNAAAARIRTPSQAAFNTGSSHCFNANEVHLMSVALSEEVSAG